MKAHTNEKHIKRYNLKFWRMERGLTQAQMAAKLGISAGHYKAIENGVYDPSLKIINKFCGAFDLGESDVQHLFSKREVSNE